MFAALMANGLIYEDEDEDEGEFEETPRLKLFSVRVVYRNRDKRNSYFTVLDVNKVGVHNTITERLKQFKHTTKGQWDTIQVHEVQGPFEAGQIIAEER
jgi:membrane-bound lytic murein transglycosylase MltF